MKLLRCPKGYVAIGIKGRVLTIDRAGNEERGYALVCDDIAEDLLKKEGYEIVDPKFYPRDINALYTRVRKTLRQESLDKLLAGVNKTTGTNIPIPVFVPTIWTFASDSNYPVTMTYADSEGNPNSFVFTHDSTLSRPCVWCRFKYWLRKKFRRNKSK